MATQIISIDRFQPPEVTFSETLTCAACRDQFDADDTHEYDTVDGKPYCTHSPNQCVQKANAAAFRREASATLLHHLDQAAEALELDRKCYPCELDEHGEPLTLVDDMRLRVKLFGAGSDTGYRTGLMYGYSEMYALRNVLELALLQLPEGAVRSAVEHQHQLTYTVEKRTEEGCEL